MIPSPTIPTSFPSSWSRRTSRALSWGRTSARTRSIPTSRAMAAAVRRLSPVIITTSSPRSRRARMARAESSFTVSATATIPAGRPSTATCMAVFPSSSRRDAVSSRADASTPASARSRRVPTSTFRPSTKARIPFPVTDSNSEGSARDTPRSSAPRTTAPARGCSEERSAEATSPSSSSSDEPSTGTTSVRAGSPFVMVPVLSRTIVRSL